VPRVRRVKRACEQRPSVARPRSDTDEPAYTFSGYSEYVGKLP
jgi:hypothetical protein